MTKLLEQIKKRRKDLGLKQKDMMLRVGMSRQQYQRLESMGNPSLKTMELIAKGLKSELMLIPQEKLAAVKSVMMGNDGYDGNEKRKESTIADDPWKDILGNEDD